MTETTEPKINAAFATSDQWMPHVPREYQHLTEAQWRAKSRTGTWAPYCKFNGKHSIAYWAKANIYTWFQITWGATHPDCIAALRKAGFEPPTAGKKRLTQKKRKGGGNNKAKRSKVMLPRRKEENCDA